MLSERNLSTEQTKKKKKHQMIKKKIGQQL